MYSTYCACDAEFLKDLRNSKTKEVVPISEERIRQIVRQELAKQEADKFIK